MLHNVHKISYCSFIPAPWQKVCICLFVQCGTLHYLIDDILQRIDVNLLQRAFEKD